MIKVATVDVAGMSQKIRDLMELRGLNRHRLAAEISDVTARRAVYRIVDGEVMPTLPSIAAIASVLDTTIDALISED